ncbi:MAG: hypothetical protein QOD69_1967 [Solirubrobacteraceae bacterium]|jgi:hypothetical protein|nr:hypothetical protein [Solirubrobacteraceae bacterium]
MAMRSSRGSHRALRAAGLAALAAIALAGCGGGSTDSATSTAAATPTTTAGSTQPATLSAAQRARFDKATKSFLSAATLFLGQINACVPSAGRKACVRRAVDRAQRVVRRTRDTVSTLATRAGGGCATQLGDVRSKITDVTDVLGPMAEATQKGQLRNAGRLGQNAQVTLRSYASSAQIVQRAC